MSSTRSRSKQSNRNGFTPFLARESINKSRVVFALHLNEIHGSRLYVGVILLSCLMAKLGDGKGKCAQNVQTSPSHHAQNPMGRSKGNMGNTSQQLSTPTRLATEQTPEIPSREHSTPTHPATEQKPKIPTTTHNHTPTILATEQTPETPGNASILQRSDSVVETDTPTERKRPARHDKDDKEKSVSEVHRLLALANATLPVAKAAQTEKDEYESEQQSKRARKLKKKPRDEEETN